MNREALVRLLSLLAAPVYSGLGSILCQHRVVPVDQLSPLPENRSIELTTDSLRAILEWVRRRGLEPITLDEMPARIANPRKPKFILFTFDDGYRDNLTHALPIFREFGVPFSVNPTTGFISRTEPVWWYAVERALLAVTSVKFDIGGVPHEYSWKAQTNSRNDTLQTIAKYVRNLEPAKRNPFVGAFCAAAGIDPVKVSDDMMMTWDEVRRLASDSLVTIGAHSGGHYDLRLFTEEKAREELRSSKQALEKEIGREVHHLAYPFGGKNAVGEREFRIVKECGFQTAQTTRAGNLFRAHRHHLHALPRLGVSGNYPAVARLEKLQSGLLPAVEHRFRRVVTA